MNKKRSALRGWRARILVVLIALSPFLVLEIVLRVTGYGRDPFPNFTPDAHVYSVSDGVVTVSPRFDHIFRTRPFPRERPEGTFRVLAIGDSVTYGWTCIRPGDRGEAAILRCPWPALLETALRQRHPGCSIEVLNCGGLAHASFRLLHVVDELLEYSPDLLILMTGSTEFAEARAYKDWKAIEDRGLGVLREWRTLTLLRDLLRRSGAEEHGEGALSEEPVQAWKITEKDEVRGLWDIDAVIEHSVHNVRRIVEACREADVPCLLCTVPCDLRYPPHFRSENLPSENWWFVNYEGELTREHFQGWVDDVRRGEDGRFVRTVERAVRLNRAGKHATALALTDAALLEMKDEPRIAVLHYCRGVALDGVDRYADARVAYTRARDLDLLPHRAPGKLNDAFRALAEEPGVFMADVEAAFVAAVPDRIPDGRLFYDNCHPKPVGHSVIATTVLSALTREGLLDRMMHGASSRR